MEIIAAGTRVKVLENGHVIAHGFVSEYFDHIGWYCVRVDGVPMAFLVNYPAGRVERE